MLKCLDFFREKSRSNARSGGKTPGNSCADISEYFFRAIQALCSLQNDDVLFQIYTPVITASVRT